MVEEHTDSVFRLNSAPMVRSDRVELYAARMRNDFPDGLTLDAEGNLMFAVMHQTKFGGSIPLARKRCLRGTLGNPTRGGRPIWRSRKIWTNFTSPTSAG